MTGPSCPGPAAHVVHGRTEPGGGCPAGGEGTPRRVAWCVGGTEDVYMEEQGLGRLGFPRARPDVLGAGPGPVRAEARESGWMWESQGGRGQRPREQGGTEVRELEGQRPRGRGTGARGAGGTEAREGLAWDSVGMELVSGPTYFGDLAKPPFQTCPSEGTQPQSPHPQDHQRAGSSGPGHVAGAQTSGTAAAGRSVHAGQGGRLPPLCTGAQTGRSPIPG